MFCFFFFYFMGIAFFFFFFFFQAEDGIRDHCVTGVQTCALPIACVPRCSASLRRRGRRSAAWSRRLSCRVRMRSAWSNPTSAPSEGTLKDAGLLSLTYSAVVEPSIALDRNR